MGNADTPEGRGVMAWLARLTGRRPRPAPLQHPGHSVFAVKRGNNASAAEAPRLADQGVAMNTDEQIRVTALVQGTVQGVGFRYWTWRQAEKLGLVGSAVNRHDGSVEVVAEGPRWAVRDLLSEIQGPDAPGAVFKVDAHYEDARGGLNGFTTG